MTEVAPNNERADHEAQFKDGWDFNFLRTVIKRLVLLFYLEGSGVEI